MDNHPIPQDITGFQFKLIGSMTIKQFIYLAAGGILAWLFFFIIPLPGVLKWLLSILSFAGAAIFAFVPVDGRPMDVMMRNFIKAISSPTQYIYQKDGGKLSSTPVTAKATQITQPKDVRVLTLDSNPAPLSPPAPPPVQENTFLKNQDLVPLPQTPVQAAPIPSVIHVSSPSAPPPSPTIFADPTKIPASVIADLKKPKIEEPKIDEGTRENKKLQEEVEKLKKELEAKQKQAQAVSTPVQAPAPVPTQSPDQALLEKQLTESMRQKEALEKQLLLLKAKMASPDQTFSPATATPVKTTQRVRKVPLGMEKSVGLPSVPEAPNLITGIVKDPRGNPISNILVEIKDSDGNPVRAFKTNGLGRFASATSLSNGKYVIMFEGSNGEHKFDAVEIELVGTPVMPLEVISVDPREELRRELFN